MATFNGGSVVSVSIYENTTAVYTLDYNQQGGDGQLSFALSGADAAKFQIINVTGLVFIQATDYENPLDANHDNVYDVVVTVTGLTGSDSQTFHVTILDRDEIHPTWITKPIIWGFPFPSRTTSDPNGKLHYLRCDYGEVTVGGDNITKRWYTSDDVNGTNSVLVQTTTVQKAEGISDAYAVQSADAGKFLRCEVTATSGGFSGTAVADWQENVYQNTSWMAQPIISPGIRQILTPVTPPTGTSVSNLRDLSDIRGLWLYTYHGISDNGSSQPIEMPNPPVWDKSGAQADIDFSFYASSAQIGSFYTRSQFQCPTLISPSFVVEAAHVRPLVPNTGGRVEFMQQDGTLVARNWGPPVVGENIWFPGANEGNDIVIYKLDAPITTITPAAILANIVGLDHQMAIDIELDRHFSGYIITNDGTTTSIADATSVYLVPTTSDIIEKGDSGSPVFVVIGGHSIVLGCVNGPHQQGFTVPNLSLFLPEITTILAIAGESPTVVRYRAPFAPPRRNSNFNNYNFTMGV